MLSFCPFHVFNAFICPMLVKLYDKVNAKYKLCYYPRITSELF